MTATNNSSFLLKARFYLPITIFIVLGLWQFYWNEFLGSEFDFRFGDFWERRIILPLGYWSLLLGIGIPLSLGSQLEKSVFWLRYILLGATWHCLLLLIEFFLSNERSALTSASFIYYSILATFAYFVVLTRLSLFQLGSLLNSKSSASINPPSPRVLILAFFIFALVFRILASHRLASMGLEVVLTNSDDSYGYYVLALKLLKGETIGTQYSTGTAAFWAMLFKIFGTNIKTGLIVQAVLSATIVFPIYYLGKWMFNEYAGTIAAGLVALNQLLVFNAANITREGVGLFLSFWALFLFCLSLRTNKLIPRVVSILLLAFVTEVDIVFLPITFILITYSIFANGKPTSSEYLKGLLLFALFVGGIILLNGKITGQYSLMSRNSKTATMILSREYSSYAETLYQLKFTLIGLLFDPRAFWERFAAYPHPMDIIVLHLKKISLDIFRYFTESSAGQFDPLLLVRNSPLAANLYFYAYLFGILGFGIQLKKVFNFRNHNKTIFIVFLTFILYVATYTFLFFGYARFRAPMEPIILLFIGGGLNYLWEKAYPEIEGKNA